MGELNEIGKCTKCIDAKLEHDDAIPAQFEICSCQLSQESDYDRRKQNENTLNKDNVIVHRTTNIKRNNGLFSNENPENLLEAKKNVNNHLFGFKKWKGHISVQPLKEHSYIVQNLYKEEEKSVIKSDNTFLSHLSRIMYVLIFGWWMAFLYMTIAVAMACTIKGFKYAQFCLNLALFIIWPFEKFIHMDNPEAYDSVLQTNPTRQSYSGLLKKESVPLIGERLAPPPAVMQYGRNLWRRPETYIWCVVGFPVLIIAHFIICFLAWISIVFIPIAKVNLKIMKRVLLAPPELIKIENSNHCVDHPDSDIIVYCYQATNIYYYKYKVDGMSVIALNLMVFVIITILIGFIDEYTHRISTELKFAMAVISIIPLSYYIGQAISSISAQSSPAIGALLNASFGTIIEIILYSLLLYKNRNDNTLCYESLVKSGLVGTLLIMMMGIPGICMIVGGMKYRSQNFNRNSTGVTASLLFVSILCVFAPTMWNMIYGPSKCMGCTAFASTDGGPHSTTLYCEKCLKNAISISKNAVNVSEFESEYLTSKIIPMSNIMSILLPIAYFSGLYFSMKTHKALIHDEFLEENEFENSHKNEGIANWSRLKSISILLVSTILVALCGDVLTQNIEPIVNDTGLSIYFIGVTVLAIIPDIPEIVNGIQFAINNNISLSIEIGMAMAVQVCMIQIPILAALSALSGLEFIIIFDQIHLWCCLFAVIMMNYVLQDGKADYFQGVSVTIVYVAILVMYYYTPNEIKC